ncbi:MAG: hypothetical protein HC767_13410 [Akkermansiaceae bacterium]|nr:hypothetical protein [Akkermansiaceae bacterium]
MEQLIAALACRNFSNRGLVGELIKDNFIYENLPMLRNFNFRGNQLGYGVAPIPNDIAKLLNLEYLCASFPAVPVSYFL